MNERTSTLDSALLNVWLVEQGLAGTPVDGLFEGFCRRLSEAGVPVSRAYVSVAALHPLLWVRGTVWERGRPAGAVDLRHGFERQDAWLTSPFRHMLETGTAELRRRLTDGPLDFPVLEELRDSGHTDWLALFHGFGWTLEHAQLGELGVITSWTTDRTGGWSEADIEAIESLARTLALAVKGTSGRSTTRDLLATYLGGDAAGHVIAGQVRRGSVERIEAVVLCADLRGFTDFAESAAPEEVTRRLNLSFDGMGGPVKEAGGEILKFLGDGFLAIFRPDGARGMAAVAAAALDAAEAILDRIGQLNDVEAAAGRPALAVDMALHEGEVTYGNVGTADRLDFTVIGPAVNQVARLEGLCKTLGRHLLVSESFARAAPVLGPRLRSLGRHALRGVEGAQEVFTSEGAARRS